MKRTFIYAVGIAIMTACVVLSAVTDPSDGAGTAPDAVLPEPVVQKPSPVARMKVPERRQRFTEYKVPAGTTLPIELRTRLSSNVNSRSDAIEGRLLRPLSSSDGVELVPAGASVLGTITEAEPAGVRQPGRLVFTFQVIEHPETGSRAMIRAAELTFQSPPPAKGKTFSDVQLEKGTDASVVLLAPLVVGIPASD